MTRQDNRNRYPFHGVPSPVFRAPGSNAYNRRSIRHRVRAWWARVRRVCATRDALSMVCDLLMTAIAAVVLVDFYLALTH